MNDDITLDEQIDQVHTQITRQEAEAQELIQRIRAAGAGAFTQQKRNYGTIPNPWAKGSENWTAQVTIERNDPALALFLAQKAGRSLTAVDENKAARERQLVEQQERMKAETARLRAAREAQTARRQHESIHGRWTPNGRFV